jgi:hypothetical protein
MRNKVFWKIRASHLSSIFFTAVLLYLYSALNKPWMVSLQSSLFEDQRPSKHLRARIPCQTLQTALAPGCREVPFADHDLGCSGFTLFDNLNPLRNSICFIEENTRNGTLWHWSTSTPHFQCSCPTSTTSTRKSVFGSPSLTFFSRVCRSSTMYQGFFIGYAYRFDYSRSTVIYEVISFLGLFSGLLVWLLIQGTYSLPIPV